MLNDYLLTVISNIGMISLIALSAYIILITGEISFGQQAYFATRTCIVIEHKLDLIKEVCENLFVLNNGKIISQGNPSLVLEQMAVIEAYIGKA